MSRINVGILSNAYPLTPPQIAQLEEDVIENNVVYAYLDDTGDLCFTMQHGVEGIKDLAWHNVYELSGADQTFTKKHYKKNGLDSFYLDTTFNKSSLDDIWLPVDIYIFDGRTEGKFVKEIGTNELGLVKVSDRVFGEQELVGSVFCFVEQLTGGSTYESWITVSDEFIVSRTAGNATLVSVEPTAGFPLIATVTEDCNIAPFGDIEKGTYFTYQLPNTVVVSGISCLRETDAL